MVKTIRIQERVIKYLKIEDKNTVEIVDYINANWKHGTDYHAMSSILGKSNIFIKKGTTKRTNSGSGGKYDIIVWGLK